MNNNKDIDYQAKLKKPFFGRFWFKKALKHIAVGAVSLGMVAGALFGFAGCVKSENQGPTIPPVDPNPPIVTPNPDDQDKGFENVNFDEFMENYKEEGVAFFNEYLKPAITEGKGDILAESVNFDASQEDALDHVSYAYIYKNGDTARKYDVVDVQFASIKFDDILNKEVEKNSIIPITQTVLSFDFDAKENVEKSDLTAALSQRMGKFDTNVSNNTHKYLASVEKGESSSGLPTLKYNILFENNNNYFVDSIKIYENNFDDAKLIENLIDDAKFDDMRCGAGFNSETKLIKLQGENIYKSEYKAEYEKEDVGPENPGHETEKNIENVEDLVTNYSTELNEGLQGAYDHIVKKVLPSHFAGFNANKIVEGKWNLQTNTSGAIEKINYLGKYELSTGNYTLFIASADFSSDPIVLNDLTDKNITQTLQTMINNKNATYNYELNFGYNEALQAQYKTLAEKVFEKEGLKEEGATYYISSITGATDQTLGSVRDMTVLQVTNNGVKQIAVRIQSGNDLAQKVVDGLYKKTEEKSYNFGDYTLNAETNKVATTSLSLYNEETGKYNIEDFGDELLF